MKKAGYYPKNIDTGATSDKENMLAVKIGKIRQQIACEGKALSHYGEEFSKKSIGYAAISRRLKVISRILPILLLTIFTACERELDITEFSDDFDYYEPELKIEAILNVRNPMSSVVVIDRSVRIDDVTVYNGIDDDGDWLGYEDENSNGRWDYGEELNDDLGEDGITGDPKGFPAIDRGEGNGLPDQGEPHVDETDEVVMALNDSTATVVVEDLASGEQTNFYWTASADSFQYLFDTDDTTLLPDSFVTQIYSAYKPEPGFSIEPSHEYSINIYSEEFDKRIVASTRPVKAPLMLDSNFVLLEADTLEFSYGRESFIFWLSEKNATTYYVTLFKFLPEGKMLISSNPSFPLDDFNTFFPDSSLGISILPPVITPGIYELTVYTMNRDLGRYFFSDLSLKDPQVSNLRDKSGKPVMGIFGAWHSSRKILRVGE